jgi:hypothetical protein
MHKGLLVVVVLGVAGSGGCSAKKTVVRTTTTVAAASKPTTTVPAPQTPSTTAGRPPALAISVNANLSSNGQDPSVLLPSSCTLVSGTVTATGTFRGGPVPETYVRYGDVVELYAYTSPVAAEGGQTFQVANLVMEKPFVIAGSGPWTVSAPVVTDDVGAPTLCSVAVQSTHAFMGAGDVGG